MYAQLFAALFALHVLAAPQLARESHSPAESDILLIDGAQVDSAVLTPPMLDIFFNDIFFSDENQLSNLTMPDNFTTSTQQPGQQPVRRQLGPAPEMISAEEAANIKASQNRKGIFYRGDSRRPEIIFKEGFRPQGSDMSLKNHLSFAGNSGYVSLSRSREAAGRYAFGRTGEKMTTGYIYIVVPKDVSNGYWIPGIYPNDGAARFNQEFAASGPVPGDSISHAYEIHEDKPTARGKKIKNPNYSLQSSPSCWGRQRGVCDPAKYNRKPSSGGRLKSKVAKTFRIGGKAGTAVAFAALLPYAHDILNFIKDWDHPIGHSVKWLDSAISSVQERIGGPQVPEIYGNELKLRIICALRGRQSPADRVEQGCARLRGEAPDEQPPAHPGRNERLESINFVLDACEKLDQPDEELESEEWQDEVLENCDVLRSEAEKIAC
ncbi:pertussis toxin, subunit 1 [Metarhizium robertsii]|uniref:Bordetella pertussis toxin A n=2 Tax=Metarhizium robertsii TaxID=568076 RepID=E9FDK8_METRA|nr:Bordetella pertussis toxin A [Metarhizium robertsii ARSEF 23]EFY94186.2 Bordetella pertussis toxin A [Metarhizium robertsii ARSEF 23]EXU96120.1 pertussis toxin, subunit 1 [Metarhizium robertsii]